MGTTLCDDDLFGFTNFCVQKHLSKSLLIVWLVLPVVWGMVSDISQDGQVCNMSEQLCEDELLVKLCGTLCLTILADSWMVFLVV